MRRVRVHVGGVCRGRHRRVDNWGEANVMQCAGGAGLTIRCVGGQDETSVRTDAETTSKQKRCDAHAARAGFSPVRRPTPRAEE